MIAVLSKNTDVYGCNEQFIPTYGIKSVIEQKDDTTLIEMIDGEVYECLLPAEEINRAIIENPDMFYSSEVALKFLGDITLSHTETDEDEDFDGNLVYSDYTVNDGTVKDNAESSYYIVYKDIQDKLILEELIKKYNLYKLITNEKDKQLLETILRHE